MELKTALKEAEKAIKNLDAAIAETVRRKAEEAEEAVAKFKEAAEREADLAYKAHEVEVSKLEEKLRGLEGAEELYEEVYSLRSKGVLETASPVKRLVFEKLAARWDSLTNAELDDLEALLEGKLSFI